MRIIAGSAGGIPLLAPPAPARPTMDRTREAIFSSLGDRVPGASVLDLFAGSGSLGLEALSRGAGRVVLVENHPACVAILRRNAEKCRLKPEIIHSDVGAYLRKTSQPQCFDLILADPPYQKQSGQIDHAAILLAEPALRQALHPEGMLVLETFAKWSFPAQSEIHWQTCLHRVYGDAAIRFLSPVL